MEFSTAAVFLRVMRRVSARDSRWMRLVGTPDCNRSEMLIPHAEDDAGTGFFMKRSKFFQHAGAACAWCVISVLG
jgi:hypothetical protein